MVVLTNPADPHNSTVMARAHELARRQIFTTDAVLTDVLTFYADDKHWRHRAGLTVHALFSNPAVEIIPESRSTFLSGLDLYCTRPDKGYSMTDCISMQAMRALGLIDVLTNDRHFEQEGFRALFRD